MREIKFRAWHFGLKKMFSTEEMTIDQMALLPDGHFANIHSSSTKLTRIFTHSEMLPLQFTGLFDKNGKEIWESDLVKEEDGSIYEIRWADVKAGWLAYSNEHLGFGLCSGESGNLEVIGNVWENSSLLKDNKCPKE